MVVLVLGVGCIAGGDRARRVGSAGNGCETERVLERQGVGVEEGEEEGGWGVFGSVLVGEG